MLRPPRLPLALALLCALFLAACNMGNGGPVSSGPPTVTPIPPTPTPNAALVSNSNAAIALPNSMATLSLGSYHASNLTATQGGLVLGSVASIGAGNLSLAYMDFTGHTPKTVATATTAIDKVVRGISTYLAGGDWVAYVQQGQQGQDWELWAVNVTTGAKQAIDSAALEKGVGLAPGSFATDGTDVVWAVSLAGQSASVLRAFNLATNTARTLATVAGAGFGDVTLANRLLFYQITPFGTNTSTSWLWLLTQPKPAQIQAKPLGSVALNSHYLVWYDADPQMLNLFDLRSGQTQQVAEAPCVNPIIAQDRPFVACLDDVDDQYQVIRTPSGTNAAFGLHATGGFGAIANGRVYWIPEPNPLSANNVVDYFDLPKS